MKKPSGIAFKELGVVLTFLARCFGMICGLSGGFSMTLAQGHHGKACFCSKRGRPKCVCLSPTCMLFGCFFQDGPVDSSIEIVPKLVKGAQTPGRQPGTARPALGTSLKEERLDGLAVEKKNNVELATLKRGVQNGP